MNPSANAAQPTPVRSLLAKLVIGASIVVALADSAPPHWHANEEWSTRVALDERSERRFLITIELAGKLYADARDGDVEITAWADRGAGDMNLAWRPLTPPEEPEGAGFPEDTFVDAGSGGTVSDAGAWPATTGWVLGELRPGTADQANVGFRLACTDRSPSLPGEPRPETCVEQFELSLARESKRALNADLGVYVTVLGKAEHQPPGTFQIRAEELVP